MTIATATSAQAPASPRYVKQFACETPVVFSHYAPGGAAVFVHAESDELLGCFEIAVEKKTDYCFVSYRRQCDNEIVYTRMSLVEVRNYFCLFYPIVTTNYEMPKFWFAHWPQDRG